jgi:acetoin utilization protein AcuB
MLLVRDRMSTPVLSVGLDQDYMNALTMMQERRLHHLPVVDAQGHLVGILGERDLLLAASRNMMSHIEVSEVMHRNVITATTTMTLAEAATLMVRHAIGGLPVVDEEQNIVGIITETDIFKAFVELLEAGESISPPRPA